MKYIVDIAGERVEVDLDGESARIGGRAVAVHASDVEGTPVHLVTVDSASHRVVARQHAERGRYTLHLDGWRLEAEALDERARAIRDLTAKQAAHAGPLPVTAPMPGLIVKVHVQPGDEVTAGQGVVSMEAMKMENELRATTAGTVRAVLVKPGSAVERGAVLVELS